MFVGGKQSARGEGFAASFPWQVLSLQTKANESPAWPSTAVYPPGETLWRGPGEVGWLRRISLVRRLYGLRLNVGTELKQVASSYSILEEGM